MQKILAITILLALGLTAGAQEPAKGAKTAETNVAALEVRADQHFLGGEWADALPMYKKLAEMLKNEPERLGAVEERIRVCQKNIAKLAKLSPSKAAASPPVPTANPVSIVPPPPTNEQRKPHAPPQGRTGARP